MKPKRIHRRRERGWRAPKDENGLPPVNVTRGSRFGNPFKCADPVIAVELFSDLVWRPWGFELQNDSDIDCRIGELGDIMRKTNGRNLMCFCSLDNPCHADILLEKWAMSVTVLLARIKYERGKLNRAAFVAKWRDGKTTPELAEIFGLSYTETLELMKRYEGVTIWKRKKKTNE